MKTYIWTPTLSFCLHYSPRYRTFENSCQPFRKWLPQPQQTNAIAIFGFRDTENKDIDTKINFLSILFAEIWDIENSCQPF